jgi:RNA polymerase sigma-70 factor (ECF subfamily)
VVDEIRRSRRRKEVPLDAVLVDRPVPGSDPEQAVQALDTRRAIVECLSRTTPERRRAATLYLLGHTVPDAARILAWSPKRAENMVFRGLADLRRCLAAKGIAP